MRGSDIFQGKSLKAEDIKGKNPVVIIDKIELKTFDDNTTKPIISFKSLSGEKLGKSLVCNRTNWQSIVEITGEDDSDRWAGKRIMLIVSRVDFQGRRVDAIRVEAPSNKPLSSRAPQRAEPDPPPEDNTPFVDDARDEDDSIPF